MRAAGGRGVLTTPRLALLALLAGGLYVPWCIGWAPLDTRDLGWIANDPAQAFLGWAFLRDESGWSFPPTWSSRMGWPAGLSTAHTDLVPLVALPLRLVEAWLPRDFQYFGLVALANGVLQAFFGLLLARRLSGGQVVATLVGGLFFLLATVFLNRLHGHFALQAQWLLLASLLLYLEAGSAGGRRRLLLACLLLWLAGGIHPYLAAMTALLLAAALLRALLAERQTAAGAVLTGVAGAATLLASFLVHGFLVLDELGGLSSWGFGIYSTNLLSLVGPSGNSWFLPDLAQTDPRQAGGSGFLGLGALVLLLAALPGLWRALRRVPGRRWWPLALAGLLAFVFAVSHRVGIAGWVALEVPLPDWLEDLANTLRASGRFVWIPHYLLLAAAIWVMARWQWRRAAVAVLLLAGLLQLLDGREQRDYVRWANAIGYRLPAMSSPLWQGLGARHAHLVVLPAWQCGSLASPGGNPGFWIFGELARRARLTINSVSLARYSPAFETTHCAAIPERFQAAGPEPATAYVLDEGFARSLALLPLDRHLCGRADDFVVCRLVEGRRGLTPALRVSLFQTLPLAQAVPATLESPYVAPTSGPRPGIAAVAFRTPAAADADLLLEWQCRALLDPLPAAGTLRLVVEGARRAGIEAEPLPGGFSLRLGPLAPDSLVGLAPLPRGEDCALRLREMP